MTLARSSTGTSQLSFRTVSEDWDQASVLVQLGLMDPSGLPVAGVEQAERLLELAKT